MGILIRVVLLAMVMGMGLSRAQDLTCNVGDVAYVSSAVNANVGLGAGAGRCLANTIAGAAYNDPAMPWGVQAALDCACVGVTVAILGDTGDYGSATASWNNRFDANKQVQATIAGSTDPVTIVGYATSGTSCLDDNSPLGCPVLMDFTGGLTDGLSLTATSNVVKGLRITGATDDCIQITGADNVWMGGLELDNCLNSALEWNTTNGGAFTNSYIHDIGDNAADIAVRFLTTGSANKIFTYTYITRITGVAVESLIQNLTFDHNILYDVSGDCVHVGGAGNTFRFNTLRDCGGDGFTLRPASGGSTRSALSFNLITGSGGWGLDSIGSSGTRPTQMIMYNVLGDNASGDINPTREPVNITLGNVEGATVVYASTTDHTPTEGAVLNMVYPRGLTTATINAGAVSEGGGAGLAGGSGGGVYIPGGPR